MPEIPTSWMAGEPDTYSIESIAALDDSALNALAAELREWKLLESDHDSWRGVTGNYYFEHENGEAECSEGDWSPTTDRNQSGELLRWAVTQGVDFMIRLNRSRPRITIFGESLITIEANDARAETIAFCAAMLAMEGRLANG